MVSGEINRQNRPRGHEAIVISPLKCSEKVEGVS